MPPRGSKVAFLITRAPGRGHGARRSGPNRESAEPEDRAGRGTGDARASGAAGATRPCSGGGGGMATSGPVTVVVVGGWGDGGGEPSGDDDLAELPGVLLLARAVDPRRAARLVDDARPQVVLAGLGRDRDAVLAVVPELTRGRPARPCSPVRPGAAAADPAVDVLAASAPERPATSSPPTTPGPRRRVRRTAAGEAVFSPGLAGSSSRRPAARRPGRGPADRPARATSWRWWWTG